MALDLAGKRVVVLTVSDRCYAGLQVDLSGPAVVRVVEEHGGVVGGAWVVDDTREVIAEKLREAAGMCDLVLTTGGTGLAERDVTPEATLSVCDRLVPGVAELIRREGEKQTAFAALGRGVCGVVGACLVINLPGNPAGAESSLRTVLHLLPHALELLAGQTSHEAMVK